MHGLVKILRILPLLWVSFRGFLWKLGYLILFYFILFIHHFFADYYLVCFDISLSRFNLPQRPLSELRPQKFPRVGDEEFAFNSCNEETDDQGEGDEEESANETDEDATERTPLLVN